MSWPHVLLALRPIRAATAILTMIRHVVAVARGVARPGLPPSPRAGGVSPQRGGLALVLLRSAPALAAAIPAAPPGVVETGMPSFVVLAPAALGLSLPPTDLHVLSDGRLLAYSRNEIALGDGQRWEVIRKAETGGDEPGSYFDTHAVAVDTDDAIYLGIQDGFARVEFGEDGYWRLRKVAPYPSTESAVYSVPTRVATTAAGWFWHSGSGLVVRWKPGQEAQPLLFINEADRIFPAPGGTFTTNTVTSELEYLGSAGTALSEARSVMSTTASVTSSAPLDARQALLGTRTQGIQVFDGSSLRPFVSSGPLAGGRAINDVCVTEPGWFAAAVDGTGLVFFNQTGRIVQVLDRTMDHRLARAERVLYADGVVWALLRDGIARVQFPTRVSSYEGFGVRELPYALPHRHDGRLWVVSGGRAHRGFYNDEPRLVGFEDLSPPGNYVHTLSTVTGSLLATNEQGIHLWENEAWRLVVPGVINARVEVPSPDGRRWAYFARAEYGWLTRDGDGFAVERFPDSRFDHDFFLIQVDGAGDIWLEMGAGKFGRARLTEAAPQLEIFSHLPDGAATWVNIFIFEGLARFNIAQRIFRFDHASNQLVEDQELLARIPLMAQAVGRPATDARGQLWLTASGGVNVIDPSASGPVESIESVPPGLLPNDFTMEEGGVVWMHEARLVRFDPSFPVPPRRPLRAVITRLTFTHRNRTLFDPPATLPPVAFADNAIALSFAAPGTADGTPVVFDVKLDGTGAGWTSTGAVGSAVWHHIREGSYTLRVRPRAGQRVGEEATLALVVRPPWYRLPLAYVAYGGTVLALILGIFWMLTYLERRDRLRLARLVEQRTSELYQANRRLEQQVEETLRQAAQLQAGEDRYRRLNEGLEQRVEERTAALHQANDRLLESYRELEAFSYSISHDLQAPLRNINGFASLLHQRVSGHGDPESDRYLALVASESVRLGTLITSLLAFSRLIRSEPARQPLDLRSLVEAVRDELAPAAAGRAIEWRIGPLPLVHADPTLLRQVFANLLGNALKFTRSRDPAVIEIGVREEAGDPDEHVLFVRDNGVGFDDKHAGKLFGVFQRLHSVREFEGTGIGLATVRRIITRHGGRVWAAGTRDQGAAISFTLPRVHAHQPAGTAESTGAPFGNP